MRQTNGERIYAIFNNLLLLLLSVVCLYPLWHVLCASLSDPLAVNRHIGAYILPDGFTVGGYARVFQNPNIISGFGNSVLYVVATTVAGVFITSMAAYVLSHKEPLLNAIIMRLIVVTMFFGGGMIPFYILIMNLGLMNTRWAIILPALVSTWNLVIMRTAFKGLPESLEESAKLDGANDFIIYLRIIMPLSGAIVAYVILLMAVGIWNAWFNAAIFLTNPAYKPLQLILRDILINNDLNAMIQRGQSVNVQTQQMDRVLVKYCTIIIAVAPIVVIYPFLQRYFVSGVMVGSLKG